MASCVEDDTLSETRTSLRAIGDWQTDEFVKADQQKDQQNIESERFIFKQPLQSYSGGRGEEPASCKLTRLESGEAVIFYSICRSVLAGKLVAGPSAACCVQGHYPTGTGYGGDMAEAIMTVLVIT